MSSAERSSIDNGIWMCRDHAKLIDSDEETYTVEKLLRWKQEAEARAEERLRRGSAAALVASKLYGTPRTPSGKFVGREEEISQLRERLRNSTAVRVAASVEGLPGIGKTELALQLVYRLARDGAFPGGIFWFDAEDPDLLPAWGGAIADSLDVPRGPVEERAAHALRVVNGNQAPTLIVLDNVETWGADLRPAPLPESPHLRYLVTTRQRHLGGAQFDEHVEVGFLGDEFARQLLEAVSGRDLAEVPGFEDLVEYLGGHALAVELAGAFLGAYPSETPASYLAELQAGGEIEAEATDLARYDRTVSQAFQTLWDRLDEETRAAWRLAACFEPEPVTAELSEAVGLTGRSFRQLGRLHLVEVAAEGGWWMHRLTREFGRGAGSEEELAAARVAFVEGCAELAQQIELETGRRPYLANRAHLDAAVRLAPEVLDSADQRASVFQDRIARGLLSIGDLRSARKLFEQALAWGLGNLSEASLSVIALRSNLALVLQDLGDLKGARDLLEQALASGLENLGQAHPYIATLRSNLALVRKDLGDLEGARLLQEQALVSGLKNLVEDHPEVAIRRSNLALVLQDLGDLEGARLLQRQALASNLANLGEDHPTVAINRSNLAGVLHALGDLESAKDLLDQALASDLVNFGEDHPFVAPSRSNLARVLEDLGDLQGARAMAEEAVRVAALQPEGSLVRSQVEAAMRGILEAGMEG